MGKFKKVFSPRYGREGKYFFYRPSPLELNLEKRFEEVGFPLDKDKLILIGPTAEIMRVSKRNKKNHCITYWACYGSREEEEERGVFDIDHLRRVLSRYPNHILVCLSGIEYSGLSFFINNACNTKKAVINAQDWSFAGKGLPKKSDIERADVWTGINNIANEIVKLFASGDYDLLNEGGQQKLVNFYVRNAKRYAKSRGR